MPLLPGAGVVIGRFQVPELHAGHQALIAAAAAHEALVILVGRQNIRPTPRNPYPYAIQAAMLAAAYPTAHIAPLFDSPIGNDHWSEAVDTTITGLIADQSAILYGSRDSFIPHYSGQFPTVLIPEVPNLSGTQVRDNTVSTFHNDVMFRRGWAAAIAAQYRITDPTVDAAVHTKDWGRVLLGRRGARSPLRFCGGFVDPSDPSYEAAVLRERSEEVLGITTAPPTYLGSARIDDPRYRGSGYGIMTTLFGLCYEDGEARAGDDIGMVEWHELSPSLYNLMTKTHHPLLKLSLAAQARHRTQ